MPTLETIATLGLTLLVPALMAAAALEPVQAAVEQSTGGKVCTEAQTPGPVRA